MQLSQFGSAHSASFDGTTTTSNAEFFGASINSCLSKSTDFDDTSFTMVTVRTQDAFYRRFLKASC